MLISSVGQEFGQGTAEMVYLSLLHSGATEADGGLTAGG